MHLCTKGETVFDKPEIVVGTLVDKALLFAPFRLIGRKAPRNYGVPQSQAIT